MREQIKRGDICYIKVENQEGSVQNGIRPFLVVSNNTGNKHSNIVIAIPITGRDKKDLPTHCPIGIVGSKSNVWGTVLCEQIHTHSQKNIVRVVGNVGDRYMKKLNDYVLVSLGMEGGVE